MSRSDSLKAAQPSFGRLRAWLIDSLSTWRGFMVTWTIIVVIILMLALVLLAGGPTRETTPSDTAEVSTLDMAPPNAALDQIRRISIVGHPPVPEFPPAQTAPALPTGRLFGLRPDQRESFDSATKSLAGLHDACGAQLSEGPPTTPSGLAQVQAALDASIKEGDKVRALVNYHHGLIDLCGGQFAAAKGEFDTAIKAMDGAGAKLKAATSRDGGRLAQYRIVTYYARALSEMAPAQPHPDFALAQSDLADALRATQDPSLMRHSGAFVDFSSAQGDLFNFSSAEIVQAQIATSLAQGDLRGASQIAAPTLDASAAVIDHPELAATLAIAAAAGGRWDALKRLNVALRTELGNDPANSAWVQTWRPLLITILTASATAPIQIYAAGDWWPGDVDGVGASPSRTAFDLERGAGGLKRDDMWFPPLPVSGEDARIVDRFLWIRREMVAAEGHHFGDMDELRRAEAALPASDRAVLANVRGQILAQMGSTLMSKAELARKAGGPEAAAPLFAVLSSSAFPATIWVTARIARVTGISPGVVRLGLIVLALVLVLAFLVHRELWIGYRRTFPHRHYDQRRPYGEDWATVRSEAPAPAAISPTPPYNPDTTADTPPLAGSTPAVPL